MNLPTDVVVHEIARLKQLRQYVDEHLARLENPVATDLATTASSSENRGTTMSRHVSLPQHRHLQAIQPVRQSSAPDMRRDATAPADLRWSAAGMSMGVEPSAAGMSGTPPYWREDVGTYDALMAEDVGSYDALISDLRPCDALIDADIAPFDALMGAGRQRRSMAQRTSELQRISQLSTLGEDPALWLQRKQSTAQPPTALSSLAALQPPPRGLSAPRGPSAPQTSPSLTSADTQISASRGGASRDESVRHGLQMIRVDSQAESLLSYPSEGYRWTGDASDGYSTHDVYHLTGESSDVYVPRPRHHESTQLVMGAGGASSAATSLAPGFVAGSSPATMVHQGGERMELSFSHESSASNSSSKSRNKQRLEVSIQTAARQLMPRRTVDEDASPLQRQPSHQSVGDYPYEAVKRAAKRPKHPQVYCTQCDDHPAFRGDHELQRHCKREHRHQVQHWICVEPAAKPSLQHPRPKRPLSDCQACVEKKRYNAYYNAAVHLRKIHFNPMSRGRNRPWGAALTHDAATDGEQWPKMPELKKHWMRSVWESKPRSAPVRQGADPGEESDADDGGVLISPDVRRPESRANDPMCWDLSGEFDTQTSQVESEFDKHQISQVESESNTQTSQVESQFNTQTSQVESEFEQGMMVYDDVDDDLTRNVFNLGEDANLAAFYDFAMPTTMSA